MAKLHELLAVEASLKNQAQAARADLVNTFDKKKHHFSETITTFKGSGEQEPPVVEARLDLQTSVSKEIDWIKPFLIKSLDASYQVAEANTSARADIVLEDGTMIVGGIPATSLLEMEKRARELQEFIKAIPTLDPAKGFSEDKDRGAGIYKARDVQKVRTKKTNKVLQLAPATDKHPAQVQLVPEDQEIGTILQQEWSGLITTAAKGVLIERIEDLERAIKKARARANEIEVDTTKNRIGEKLFKFVFAGY